MVPFAKARLGLDEAGLGLVLLAIGVGALVAMPLAGIIAARVGTRIVIAASGAVLGPTLPLLTLAPSPAILAILLFLLGASAGSMDVAMNGQGVAVERLVRRPVMSWFHGLFSVGGLSGAAGMSLLLAAGVNVTLAAAVIGAAILVLVAWRVRGLLPAALETGGVPPKLAYPRGRALGIGVLTLIVFLAEGAVLDWSAVFLQELRGFDEAGAGLGFAAFSIAMAAVRLTGDRINARIGATTLVCLGALVAAAGFVLAVSTASGTAALLGFLLVGLGCANIAPILISAAGRLPDMPSSTAVSAVVTIGYLGMLAGPPVIGLVAQVSSLPFSLGLLAVLLVFVALFARLARGSG